MCFLELLPSASIFLITDFNQYILRESISRLSSCIGLCSCCNYGNKEYIKQLSVQPLKDHFNHWCNRHFKHLSLKTSFCSCCCLPFLLGMYIFTVIMLLIPMVVSRDLFIGYKEDGLYEHNNTLTVFGHILDQIRCLYNSEKKDITHLQIFTKSCSTFINSTKVLPAYFFVSHISTLDTGNSDNAA